MPNDVDEVIAAVRETLRTGRPAAVPDPSPAGLPELLDEIVQIHGFVMSLSQGDLSPTLTRRGTVAGALKTLQASLRHVTWQTQRVAAGDFSQRVDFMGEFSAAFNSMVSALARAHEDLSKRNDALLRLNLRLEEMATTDALTGALNRRRFYELLDDELERATRYGRPLGLLMLDVDHFKRVNDAFGHATGDEVLKGIAAVLRLSLRAPDRLARWGGEEFVVLAPDTGGGPALALAQRVCHAIRAEQFPVAGTATASIGVAERRPGESGDALLARADAALYEAKDGGRDRAVLAG